MSNVIKLDEYNKEETDNLVISELNDIDFEAVTKDMLGIKENKLLDHYNKNERKKLNDFMAKASQNLDKNIALLQADGGFHF